MAPSPASLSSKPSSLRSSPSASALSLPRAPIASLTASPSAPPRSPMAFLEVKGVSKGFGPSWQRSEVLHDINLQIDEGEFVAIIGYSGAGKTTLMSLLAGLTQPDTGEVLLGGQKMDGPGPDRGIVFQNYSLLPWLTVYENVALAVDQVFPDWTPEQRRAHTEKYIATVNLTPALRKVPSELSGGMR